MLRCHSEHEVVEVGLRRNFRCDCATGRSTVHCQALPVSSASIAGGTVHTSAAEDGGEAHVIMSHCEQNAYGQNFDNRFCSCHREYTAARDELIQCIACDEW